MTDNDIRGYLDGGFIWGWNQATQIHVRLGRTGEFPRPMYGEVELFRVLQRWDGITLPPNSEISACRLTLRVEEGPDEPLRLFVYSVNRDWGPGSGGEDGNNVSVPKQGEVWWGNPMYGDESWGLPGAGFASESHPEADTPVCTLAETLWRPGEEELVFESDALARYATKRIRDGKPLLLLLKLTDAQEDTPGAFLNLFSGEHGDSRNVVRRPRLDLEWNSSAEVESVCHDVLLEYGRVCELPRQASRAGTWAASFEAEAGCGAFSLQLREGHGKEPGPWRPAALPFEPKAEWFQLRVMAMHDPIALGNLFEAEMADTWVLTGPPEKQHVPWYFESPTGAVHEVAAEYVGKYRWRIRFTPDEVGTWRFHWSQDFLPAPYQSAPGRFHVWADRLDEVVRLLGQLCEAVVATARSERFSLHLRLYALEREGMRLLTPAEYHGADGERHREAVRRARSSLWGRPVPDPIPMRSHPLVSRPDSEGPLDPVLDASGYEERGKRPNRRRIGTPLRRLWRRLRRLAPRRGEPEAGDRE